MRVNLGWKAAAALFTLALVACGDDPDETVPALTLTLDEPRSTIYTPESSFSLSGTIELGAELAVVATGDATVSFEVTGETWSAIVSNPPADSAPPEGEAALVTITATDDPGNTNMIQLVIVFDATPPGIKSKTPEAEAVGVSLNSNVAVTFNEELIEPAIPDSTFVLTDVSGNRVAASVRYDAIARAAILDPELDLLPQTIYTVALSFEITDLTGNTTQLTEPPWTFTTAAGSN